MTHGQIQTDPSVPLVKNFEPRNWGESSQAAVTNDPKKRKRESLKESNKSWNSSERESQPASKCNHRSSMNWRNWQELLMEKRRKHSTCTLPKSTPILLSKEQKESNMRLRNSNCHGLFPPTPRVQLYICPPIPFQNTSIYFPLYLSDILHHTPSPVLYPNFLAWLVVQPDILPKMLGSIIFQYIHCQMLFLLYW